MLLLGKLIELLELGTPLAAAQLWEEYEKKVSGFKFSKNEHSRNREGTIVLPTKLTTFLI